MSAMKRRRPSIGRVFWNKLTKPHKAIWDVGSVRTRVMVRDTIVFDQPTALAVRQDTEEVIAVGDAAYSQVGAGSRAVQVEFPIARGTIGSENLAVYWLQHIRQELWPNRKWLPFSFSPGGSFLVPPGVGVADRTEWLRVFSLAGLHFVTPSQGVISLPLLVNLPESELFWSMVMGGDHSVIVLMQGGKVIQSQSVQWGGVQLSEAVQFWLASERGVAVSWKTAEELKLRHGSLTDSSDKKIVIRGKNPATQLGMTTTVTVGELRQSIELASEGLVLHIQQFLASLPAGQATDCIGNGIWLVGGTARLRGIDTWLAGRLGCSVSVVEEPETALLRAEGLHVAQ